MYKKCHEKGLLDPGLESSKPDWEGSWPFCLKLRVLPFLVAGVAPSSSFTGTCTLVLTVAWEPAGCEGKPGVAWEPVVCEGQPWLASELAV